jgi:GT2 family glycosyltransferase
MFNQGRVGPVVSVIVLTYNGRRWLTGCLDALSRQVEAPPFEIILLDNGSADGSAAFVRDAYPHVTVIETDTNLGFAGGNNVAAAAARGAWLAFLNNDTVADEHWLSSLVAASRARPEFTLFTSCLVYMDAPDIVDSAGDGYYRAGGAFKRGHGQAVNAFRQPGEVFGACGGAFMMPRAAFQALSGFDERFFMIYEDVDFSYRARLRGWRAWYVPEAIVRHAGSASLGTVSRTAVFYGQRNLEWTWIKNTPGPLLARTAFAHAVYSLAGVAHYVRMGRGAVALRGKIAALRGLPAILAERRRVQRTRTADARTVAAPMEPRWLRSKRREKAFVARRLSVP